MLQQNKDAVLGVSEMNSKFAASADIFDASFGGFDEFLNGVAGHVGLPATILMDGMQNDFCHSEAAHTAFTTSNYGGTTTTAAGEYEFVVKPDLTKEYSGGRRATTLDVYLLTAGAARRNDGERLNMPLAEIAGRFGADILDSVKTEVLRKAKEAFMMASPLQRAADQLKIKLKTNPWNTPSSVHVAGWDEDTINDKTHMLVDYFSIVAGNVRGSGQDGGGIFAISGTESDGQVTFEKTYDVAAAVSDVFRSLDTNGNGVLSFEEFKSWIQGEYKGQQTFLNNVKGLFDAFDKEHNNTMSEFEFLQTCSGRCQHLPSLSHLAPQSFTGTTGHDAAAPYIAGTWSHGRSAGEFRLDLRAGSQATQLRRITVLEELVARGTVGLKAARKAVTRALTDATKKARVASTGGTSFRAVASVLTSVLSLEQLEVLLEVARANLISAQLVEEEVIGLRLYTGPSFTFINGSLRNVEANSGHCNVIHAICSGLTKLSTVAGIPVGRIVYRGLGGMRLPHAFWRADANGAKGGCERAFLSTTTDLGVALMYLAGRAMPTVFAIQCGAVDKGACISWLSQYPEEDEVLMPPRSFVEVVDDPVVRVIDGNEVMEIPLRISCNLNTPTLEKSSASRRTQVFSMLNHTTAEIHRDVDALMLDPWVGERAKTDNWCTKDHWAKDIKDAAGNERTPTDENSLHNSGMVEGIKKECAAWVTAVLAHDAAWFNVDANYKSVMAEAIDLRRLAVGKILLWRDDPLANARAVKQLTLRAADQQARRRKLTLLQAAKVVRAYMASPSVVTWWRAPRNGDVEMHAGELCADEGLIVAAVDDTCGETPLMRQVALGAAPAIVVLLVDAGEDPRAVDSKGATALHLAAQGGHTDTVLVLAKECGADVHASTSDGETAVLLAAENGHTATVLVMAKELGADVNAAKDDGRTAVIIAARNGHTATVVALATVCLANVNAVLENGSTALIIAAQNGHTATVLALATECGADVNAAREDGCTALMFAAQNGHTATMLALATECGADMNAARQDGFTAVMLAVQGGHLDMVSRLVTELKADAGSSKSAGVSCLHVAAAMATNTGAATETAGKMTEVVLEHAGLDLLLRTDATFGWTPLHYALYVGNEALARTLVERQCSADGSNVSERYGHAMQDVLSHTHAPLSLFRGLPYAVKVGQDDGVVAFGSFCSVRSRVCCPPGTRGYYELTILETNTEPQYGFVPATFTRMPGVSYDGVGDDDKSWAVDGVRQWKWHNGEEEPYTCTWNVGDVVGLACDLLEMKMHVSVNGCFGAPNGLVFHLDADTVQHGLFAAFTGSSGKVQCNLGAAPFQHAPPSANFKAFVDFDGDLAEVAPATLVSTA